jgi:hypothetical protein
MLFKRISRTNAETVFIVVKNVSGSTITAGYACVFDVGASVDGVRVSQSDAEDIAAFAGLADADISNNAYGLVQVYGYRASGRIWYSSTARTAGNPLGCKAATWCMDADNATGDSQKFGFLCAARASSPTSSQIMTKVFIRAL